MSMPLWVNNSGVAYSPLLQKEVEFQAQPDLRFQQFCDFKEAWGKNAGETFLYDYVSNIDTAGGKLTETSTIPTSGYTITQGTGTLYEFGITIPWSRKYEDLAQIQVRKVPVKLLSDDYAKCMDGQAEGEFNNTRIRYVATSTGAGYVSTNGTATATCSCSLTKTHAENIIDYMYQTMLAKPYSGDDYMAIVSTDAHRNIYDTLEPIMQYTKFPQRGEMGRYYSCRFIRTNYSINNAMVGGGSATYGEAYFLGGMGLVANGVATRMEIRQKEVLDSGRSRGLTWYAVEGYDLSHKGNPDNNVCKFTTNGDNATR